MTSLKHSVFIAASLALLSACSGTAQTSIEEQNRNPLTASRYGDELADSMANMVIQEDPVSKDPVTRKIIDAEIERGKTIGDDARMKHQEGMRGGFVEIKAEVMGYVLYVDDTVYFSLEFLSEPGADLRVLHTTVVDPRDVAFPDPTSIDLGPLQSVYGAQQYSVPHQEKPELYRTVVIFDKKLKRIYGFVQLSK